MLTDVGHLCAWFALAVALYAVATSLLGARRNDERLVQSGRIAAALTFPLLLLAAAGLWFALITNDFGVKYVSEVSSRATPLFFRITALWGSQNGSMLFWSVIMSAFICACMSREWKQDKSLLPFVAATMCLILAFFIGLNLLVTSPFERLDFPPIDGRGLNPLLRHPGMIIHPPILYAGFTGFIVPFAFCVASLATRNTTNQWLLSSRRWTLVGWAFLTAGLLLGGRWAHDVLGWGGYWGWDPVENKSFVPWLLGTAFLHSAMIQEKRGMFKNWNVCLMLLTFVSIVWGTAVVRSGVLTSVHAFAQSNLGPLFLGFIVIMLSGCMTLWLTRLDTLRSDNKLESAFSREGIFLIQNLVFVSAAVTVFVGTTFPIFTEAINGTRITVGPPFYNQTVVPQLGLLVLLMGVAPLLAWRKANAAALGRFARVPIVFALIIMAGLAILGTRNPLALLALGLCAYTLAQTVLEYVRGTRARMKAQNEVAPRALGNLIRKNQRRYGGYLVHVGVVLLAIGAIGKGLFGSDVVRNFDLNQTVRIGDYNFTYRGLSPAPCEFTDCQTVQAALWVTRPDGSVVGNVFPHRDVYPDQQHTATIADTTGGFNEEIYVILSAWEGQGENATFQVYLNPLINWVWLGGIVMILGFVLAFWPMESQPQTTTQRLTSGASGTRGAGAGVATTLVLIACLAGLFTTMTTLQPVLAQAPDPNTEDATYHVAKQLNCPTCTGRNLADCPTETCEQWKGEIRTQLKQGKTPTEIIGYFQARFGETVMQEPPKRGLTLGLWLLPVIAALALMITGVVALRTSSVRLSSTSVQTTGTTPAATSKFVDLLERQVQDS